MPYTLKKIVLTRPQSNRKSVTLSTRICARILVEYEPTLSLLNDQYKVYQKDTTVGQWSKCESKVFISIENQIPNPRGKSERCKILVSTVAGNFWSHAVDPPCFIRSTVNTAVYLEILEHFMLPSTEKLYKDTDFTFQQNLAPAHSFPIHPRGVPNISWLLECFICSNDIQTGMSNIK